jgi:NitT/TauT family transport system ATP-binding protein
MESLVIKNLNFTFKNAKAPLFSNWNLRLKQGHICAVVGPSGIGKTSLGLMIAGHLKPDSGEIVWNEKKVLKPLRDVFLIHQEDDLFPWLTVYEQLKFVGGSTDQIENLLKQFKLSDFKNYYPNQLSGGMKKRLAIMRAECAGASLLILDETLSSLDKALLKEILSEMVPHWKALGKTVVLITHQLDDVKEFVDTIVRI